MNIHVTTDPIGEYSNVIAESIAMRSSFDRNQIVNLCVSSILKNQNITFLLNSEIEDFVCSFKKIDKVIFHPFNLSSIFFIEIVKKQFPNVKVVWISWSYELYNLPWNAKNIYESFSKNYVEEKNQFTLNIFFYTKNILRKWKEKNRYKKMILESYGDVNHYGSLFKADFKLLKKSSLKSQINHFCFSYQDFREFNKYAKAQTTERSILIGHSSSPEGNHYEVLRLIESYKIENKIIIPLTYGDMQYKKLIIENSKKMKNTVFLEEQLTKNEYFGMLNNIEWAIFNFKVQQALGNILFLLWNGTKIFFNEENPIFHELKEFGIIIFSIKNDLNPESIVKKLSPIEKETNNKKIEEFLSVSKVNQGWNFILNECAD